MKHLLVGSLLSLGATAYAGDLKVKFVSQLERIEPRTEQIYLADRLWSLNSRQNAIDVFGTLGEKQGSISVPHGITQIARWDDQHLIVYGKKASYRRGWFEKLPTWRTCFTTIDVSDYSQETHELPNLVNSDQFIVSAEGEIFFVDPSAQVVRRYWLGGKVRDIPVQFRYPIGLVLVGNILYVVESYESQSDVSNLIRVDLTTHESRELFPGDLPEKIYDIILLDDGKTIAAAQTHADKVLLVDTATDRHTLGIPVKGTPRSLGALGRCLLVASQETRKILFLDWQRKEVVGTWDLNPLGDKFKFLSKITVDRSRNRIYMRSGYWGNYSPFSQNAVYFAEDPEIFRKCLTHPANHPDRPPQVASH